MRRGRPGLPDQVEMVLYDLAIVGGGPAGLTLAERAAAGGARVCVLDPRTPWEKPCGGGLSPRAAELFPFLAAPDTGSVETDQARLVSPGGIGVTISGGKPFLAVSRLELARRLLDRATQAGAEHVPCRVASVVRERSQHCDCPRH